MRRVKEALEHMESGIRDLRELAAGIHPSVLTDRGLSAALGGARRPLVDAGSTWAGAPRPAADPGRDIRILRGSRGAQKRRQHAGCSHVQVGMRVENGSATVEVEDDGAAARTPPPARGCAGWPIASALGGGLEIESPAGEGTTVRARIALSAPKIDRGAARTSPGTNAS